MDCPHIPEIPYSEFSGHLHSKGAIQRLPLSASIELTERCNLNCAHCYINRPAGDQKAKKRELNFQQWSRILDEMAEAGCLWLLLTGGEPLLHADFQKIYLYAKQRGMIVTLFTNATLLTPEVADFLRDWPPFEVEVSVYGRTKATYESVTRIPGSYEKCLRGINLLLERQIPLELKTMVMTLNTHELWELKAWAEGLGVRFRYDPVLNARLDGGKTPIALRLPPEQVVAFDLQDKKRFEEWQDFVGRYLGAPASDYLYTCGGGVSSFHLNPSGQMYICMMVREAGFDLTRGSLQEGWEEFIPRLREKRPQGKYPCGRCDLLSLCGQCPGWAQTEGGDSESPVDYLCQIAHRRAEALGVLSGKNEASRSQKGNLPSIHPELKAKS